MIGVCSCCGQSAITTDGLCDECSGFTASKDKQVGGSHYDLKIQPIDYILQNKLGYCEGNIIKYISRHGSKHGAEDIKKAIHYCEFILANQYGEEG